MSGVLNIKKFKEEKFAFICTECQTRYYTPENRPPPPIRWKDGHVCTLTKYNQDEQDGKSNPVDSGRGTDR